MSTRLNPLAPFRMDSQVVVVTGASSGLGERFARILDALGATTVLAARRRDRLDSIVAELDHAEAVECDFAMGPSRDSGQRAVPGHVPLRR